MTPSEVVLDFIDAWNVNDMDRVVGCMSEDVFYHNVPMTPITGREAVRTFLAAMGPLDWVSWKVLAIAECGFTVLTERLDEFGLRGRDVSLPVMGAFEVRDGRIAAWRDYFDLEMYRQQLLG